tara:strand:- start:2078 stop:2854 length:777 start_codon:yes stop_codon:yes gene_type:complete
MISSYFQGGLGNQLFQIAAALSLAADNNDTTLFNPALHDLPKQGRKTHNYTNSILRNINFSPNYKPYKFYQEPHFHYKKIPYAEDICLVGYFQSEKYFSNNPDLIREAFSIDNGSNDFIDNKYGKLLEAEPVSVHIRRGDYMESNGAHPVCTREYYEKAFEQFNQNTKYLFFSDDIQWCKKSFVGKNYHFAENNEDVVDLYLMSRCGHNIIANSSFSWWSSWLNTNPEKRVIAPKHWFGGDMNNNVEDLSCEFWNLIY